MRVEAIPVVRGARTLGVITMHTHAIAQRTPSRLELTYRHLADALVPDDRPWRVPVAGGADRPASGSSRWGDGVIVLDVDGGVTYASPNALGGPPAGTSG